MQYQCPFHNNTHEAAGYQVEDPAKESKNNIYNF